MNVELRATRSRRRMAQQLCLTNRAEVVYVRYSKRVPGRGAIRQACYRLAALTSTHLVAFGPEHVGNNVGLTFLMTWAWTHRLAKPEAFKLPSGQTAKGTAAVA